MSLTLSAMGRTLVVVADLLCLRLVSLDSNYPIEPAGAYTPTHLPMQATKSPGAILSRGPHLRDLSVLIGQVKSYIRYLVVTFQMLYEASITRPANAVRITHSSSMDTIWSIDQKCPGQLHYVEAVQYRGTGRAVQNFEFKDLMVQTHRK